MPRPSAGIVLAVATFVLGLGVGALLGPAAGNVGPVAASSAPAVMDAPRANGLARSAHPAEVLRVVDGDTFEAKVHLWPGLDVTTKVRLRGIDAPEMRARCAEERNKAEAARDALKALLDQGEVGIFEVTLDKYGGRVLAAASTSATRDVSVALLALGMARPYAGGRRQSWCF